jgi:hypothetical protein
MKTLSPATIVRWMKEARPNKPAPSITAPAVIAIARDINWLADKNWSPEVMREASRMSALQAELRQLLPSVERVLLGIKDLGHWAGPETDWSEAILWGSKNLREAGSLEGIGRGKRWHAAARLLARRASDAWGTVGFKPSHKKEDGPLMHFIVLALDHLLDGKDVPTASAVAGALKRSYRAHTAARSERAAA